MTFNLKNKDFFLKLSEIWSDWSAQTIGQILNLSEVPTSCAKIWWFFRQKMSNEVMDFCNFFENQKIGMRMVGS